MMLTRASVEPEQGSVAVELSLGIGLLVLPMALLVLLLPTWLERQSMARVAAQEAARSVVVAADPQQAGTIASQVVTRIAVNYGLPAEAITVRISGGLDRGQVVTATVSVDMPATNFPGLTEVGGFSYTTAHREVIDPYRSLP
ncbi:MAG: hypothetical protein M3425_07045 [Actinomycetota bacterium]|jgi:hypothetical protein|nr:hypothetical protein [Euzebyales bacterium]MDQ3343911.1 hypothetical protein [Actinomycetota bacterium]MDQ3529692.1 hypothetical protein [Actinomycetota bacterium]